MYKTVGSLLFVICVVALMFTGRMSPPDGKAIAKPAPAADPGQSEADLINSGGEAGASTSGTVVLERAPDGHFYADAVVNGTNVHFMVDTGATSVALSPKDAAAIGIEPGEGDFTETGRGVGGNVAMKPVTLDKLSIGGITSRDVPAVVVQTDMEVSLLGQTWLSRIGTVKIENNRMTLH